MHSSSQLRLGAPSKCERAFSSGDGTFFIGPVLGIFGGADNSIPVEDVQAFEATLNQVGIQNEITHYEGQLHAFGTASHHHSKSINAAPRKGLDWLGRTKRPPR